MTYIKAVVEGDVDAAVVRRLAAEAQLQIAEVHVRGGKEKIRSRIGAYARAAEHLAFFVLVDLDREFECAPGLVSEWIEQPKPRLCFRVAVKAIEAWLLADQEACARFLRVRRASIPDRPEDVADPKAKLVDLARSSSDRSLRADIVPRPGSGRVVGPAYSSRLIEFVNAQDGWSPVSAAQSADSLGRARRSLTRLRDFLTTHP